MSVGRKYYNQFMDENEQSVTLTEYITKISEPVEFVNVRYPKADATVIVDKKTYFMKAT
jgi:hypothetical protein